MAILTDDMKRVIREQRLGFYATVCEDGSPNLSPKGTTFVLDDDHLFFADVRSPQTVANIRRGSLVEVNSSTRSSERATGSRDRPWSTSRGTSRSPRASERCAKPGRRSWIASARSWLSRSARPGPSCHPPTTMAPRPRPSDSDVPSTLCATPRAAAD